MECFYWAVGVVFERQYTNFRQMLTKVASFVTIIQWCVWCLLYSRWIGAIYTYCWKVCALKVFPPWPLRLILSLNCWIIEFLLLLICYYLRWDVNAINDLPDYMELCFLTDLYNTINEKAYENLKEKGANILPYLTKAVHVSYSSVWLFRTFW